VESNKLNKSNRPDVNNAERHSEERYGTSTDIMLTTTNRFGILSDLDKIEEWPRIEDDLRGCPWRQRRKFNYTEAMTQYKIRVDQKFPSHVHVKYNTVNGKPEDLVYQIPVVVDGLTSSDMDVLQNRKELINHRIIIIGDSHARDAAGNVIDNLDDTYSISGFVCPGMNVRNMIPLMTLDITHLNCKDAMILWGGANDVYKNNSGDALKHITNFLELNKHTNIIILCIPHRHDLPDWSCVNRGILVFNRALMKLMKLHNHVAVVQVDPARMYYTKHGQHVNNMGRERIASKLAEVITDLFSTEEEIITLPRKSDTEMMSGSSDSCYLDSDLTSRKDVLSVPPVVAMAPEATSGVNEQPDRDSDSDSNSGKGVESVPSNQTQVMIAIGAREDEIASYDQTQAISHTMNCGSVSNSPELLQNNPTLGENMFQPHKQDVADKPIHDHDSDIGKDSIGADNGDSDSNTRNDIDSGNDSATTAATDGAVVSPTRAHVVADLAEIRRTSTRNKKAPSSKSSDFLW
jgi:hypothetical protein